MKRILSLLLLLPVLLHAVGYSGLLFIVQHYGEQQTARRLEQNAGERNGEIIFSIPVSNPDAVNTNYSPIAGRFTYEGKLYHRIKQKQHNNRLYIVCMLDDRGTVLQNMLSEHARSFSNEDQNHSTESIPPLAVSKYYVVSTAPSLLSLRYGVIQLQAHPGSACYHDTVTRKIFQPPKQYG